MDYKLTEEQAMLKSMASDFLKNKFTKPVLKDIIAAEPGQPPEPELYKEMAGLGWMGLIIPETFGGSGNSFLDLAVLLEEMGRACIPSAFFASVLLGAYPILEAGSDAQKKQYLPLISSGTIRFTAAILENDGLFAADSIKTTAKPVSDGFIMEGVKMFVPSAKTADFILCAARSGKNSAAEKEIDLFIVDAKSPGLEINALNTLDGGKQCEVIFNKVKVPAGNILGKSGAGWELVSNTFRRAAVASCCDILGSLQQILDMTVQYVKDRKQFDQPIGKFQIIQHYCAEMATDIEGLRYSAYRAAWALSEGQAAEMETAVARTWAAQTGEKVLAFAHQIHGAIGVTIDHDLQYYTKHFKTAAQLWGDEDSYREKVAEGMGL